MARLRSSIVSDEDNGSRHKVPFLHVTKLSQTTAGFSSRDLACERPVIRIWLFGSL